MMNRVRIGLTAGFTILSLTACADVEYVDADNLQLEKSERLEAREGEALGEPLATEADGAADLSGAMNESGPADGQAK